MSNNFKLDKSNPQQDLIITTEAKASFKEPKLFSKAGVAGLFIAIIGFFLSFQLLGIYLFAPLVFKDQVLTPVQRFGMGGFDGTVTSYSMFFTLVLMSVLIFAIVKSRISHQANSFAASKTMTAVSTTQTRSASNDTNIEPIEDSTAAIKVADYLGIKPFPLYLAVAFIGLWLVFIVATETLTFMLDKDPTAFVDDLYASANPKWLLILAMVLVAPIYEELMFRGILWRAVSEQFSGKKGMVMASIITSIVFSIIHFQYEFYEMSIVFLLAMLLSYARAKSGSVVLPIIIHILNNGLAMWLYVMVQ